MKDKEINELIEEENKHLFKLKEIVARTMEDEKSILKSLIRPSIESISTGQRVGHKVVRFCRSWAFILSFLPSFFVRISFNTLITIKDNFDSYPFILMNLMLSCIAALQAQIIIMSQNRLEEKDRKTE